MRSMVQAHTLLQIQDTTMQWLYPSPKLQFAKSRAEGLGGTHARTKRTLGGGTSSGGSYDGQGTWSSGKEDKSANPTKKNKD